jgi:putative membrane protein
MRLASLILLAGGVALFLGLIVEYGIGEVYAATAVAGWGVVAVAAFHLVPMFCDAMAWRATMPAEHRLSLAAVTRLRWIGESVSSLLPAAPVSGDLVRTRLAMFAAMPGPVAGATVTADLTLGALTQVVFSLLGVALLASIGVGVDGALVGGMVIGLLALTVLIVIFLVLQNAGLFRFLAGLLARAARGRAWLDLVGGAEMLDAELAAIYARRRSLARSAVWRLVSWVAGTGEIWLALHFLGHPIGLVEAIMIESMIQALRSAAFAIPAGLGVQEGGFIVLGAFVGLGAEISLAMALIRRARELAFGIPALIFWQVVEARRALRRRT